MASDARKTAWMILNKVAKDQSKTLDSLTEHLVFEDRRDRALFHTLLYGVLRWQAKLDWVIAQFSKTPMENIDPKILNILRIGIFQIIYSDRIPVSAAVNTSVEMAKTIAPEWTVRFVNGLLRNISRNQDNISFPDSLSVMQSFPEWLIQRWIQRFGHEETEQLCKKMNQVPKITFRTNTLKTSRENLMTAIQDNLEYLEKTALSPLGLSCEHPNISIAEMKAFKDGWFQVQDESAQLIGWLLNPQPGEKILDACAGLGGKTGLIAQMMNNQGSLIAADKDKAKLLRLETEMNRLGISIVKTMSYDLEKPSDSDEQFDRVLVDAPCSGLGVIRRNPDIKWSLSKKNLNRYADKQLQLLENASIMVKSGGVLVYAVCSMEYEENESVISRFSERHSDFEIEKDYPEIVRTLISSDGFFKTFPHIHDMDGFFAVCLRKQS